MSLEITLLDSVLEVLAPRILAFIQDKTGNKLDQEELIEGIKNSKGDKKIPKKRVTKEKTNSPTTSSSSSSEGNTCNYLFTKGKSNGLKCTKPIINKNAGPTKLESFLCKECLKKSSAKKQLEEKGHKFDLSSSSKKSKDIPENNVDKTERDMAFNIFGNLGYACNSKGYILKCEGDDDGFCIGKLDSSLVKKLQSNQQETLTELEKLQSAGNLKFEGLSEEDTMILKCSGIKVLETKSDKYDMISSEFAKRMENNDDDEDDAEV
jgi:hypothetical protein